MTIVTSTLERPLTALEQASIKEAAEIVCRGFQGELYKIFVNCNKDDTKQPHSLNFVFRFKNHGSLKG